MTTISLYATQIAASNAVEKYREREEMRLLTRNRKINKPRRQMERQALNRKSIKRNYEKPQNFYLTPGQLICEGKDDKGRIITLPRLNGYTTQYWIVAHNLLYLTSLSCMAKKDGLVYLHTSISLSNVISRLKPCSRTIFVLPRKTGRGNQHANIGIFPEHLKCDLLRRARIVDRGRLEGK